MQPLPSLVAPKCGYLNDLWSTNMIRYEPFPALLQVNKQTFMSSTQVRLILCKLWRRQQRRRW